MSKHVDLFEMLYALRAMLSKGSRDCVDRLQETARGYVWGAEDHGHERVKSAYGREIIDASYEFACMYAIYAAMYELEMIGSRQPIQDAWRAFTRSVDIDQYV